MDDTVTQPPDRPNPDADRIEAVRCEMMRHWHAPEEVLTHWLSQLAADVRASADGPSQTPHTARTVSPEQVGQCHISSIADFTLDQAIAVAKAMAFATGENFVVEPDLVSIFDPPEGWRCQRADKSRQVPTSARAWALGQMTTSSAILVHPDGSMQTWRRDHA